MEEEKLQNIAIHAKKIRTMGKDLALLREQEAREERERIAADPKSLTDVKKPFLAKIPSIKEKIITIKEKITNQGAMAKKIKEPEEDEITRLKNALEPILEKEKQIEIEKQEIEKKEKSMAFGPEKREIEKTRWKIENKLHALEKEKWEMEKKIEKIKTKNKKINEQYQEIPKKEETRKAEEPPVKELPREKLPIEAEKLPAEELPREAEELPAEELPAEAEKLPAEELPREAEELPAEKEAKGLPAEELPTEAEELKKTEEEKILETKIEETREELKEKKEEIIKNIPGQEPYPRKKLTLPAPLSLFEKIFTRIVIITALILTFLNLFLFCYWYFYIKKLEPPSPPAAQQEEIVVSEEEPSPALEITIPLALFPINKTESLEIKESIALSETIYLFLEKSSAENGFTRILIKDSDKNKLLGIKEFFQSLQIKSPADFSDSLDNNFTFFVYSQTEGPRMGFAALITEKSRLMNSLKIWETTMEKDFESFFILLNKKEPALVSFFKDGSCQGKTIRYQTFSKNDLGICYVIFEDYFIFTSSWKSMEKVIAFF